MPVPSAIRADDSPRVMAAAGRETGMREPETLTDAELCLYLAPGIGPRTLRKLRAHFPADVVIIEASERELTEVPGVGKKTADSIRRAIGSVDPDAERRAMREREVRLIAEGDDDYPPLLAATPDPPPALWIQGNIEALSPLSLAIVGSRQCSPYGREQAGRFASLIAGAGLTIVSGGALGIDAEAHRGALRIEGGRTVAVMGCGLSHIYPPHHKSLFARIVDSGGALVSEYPMDAAPRAEHFPRRNRIISGLSLGVLIIEAGVGSGALITGRIAAEDHGREVMALPGRVDSPASAGSLALIRSGGAALVVNHADVLSQLDGCSQLVRGAVERAGAEHAEKRASLFEGMLTEGQRAIMEYVTEQNSPVPVDMLAVKLDRPLSEIMADLTLLELHGRVRRDHHGVRSAK
jgi:DNA processing protein